jgi:thioredoxin-like negative regulator of GroEL
VRAQLLRADLPLVVEFTSSRVRQRPLATRPGGIELADTRLPVRAVDIDAYPDLRRRFKINLLPTFVVLHDSAELARFVGPHSRRELTGAIRRALDPAGRRTGSAQGARTVERLQHAALGFYQSLRRH